MNYLISEYIKKLTIDDIFTFANKNNININKNDANTLYFYAKNHYNDFLSGNDSKLIKEIKDKIDPSTFKEAYKIYLEYKIKYLK